MKLSEHFDSTVFACKCGCGGMNNGAGVDPRLVQVLERMRPILGVPLELSCGYRCPTHNAEVGGVWNSQHVYGKAADVLKPSGVSLQRLVDAAETAGADGIGVYDWGVHIDVRRCPARW